MSTGPAGRLTRGPRTNPFATWASPTYRCTVSEKNDWRISGATGGPLVKGLNAVRGSDEDSAALMFAALRVLNLTSTLVLSRAVQRLVSHCQSFAITPRAPTSGRMKSVVVSWPPRPKEEAKL